MKSNKMSAWIAVLLLLAVSLCFSAAGQPSGAGITYNTSEIKAPAPAQYLNTSGGSFTTMILSAETQDLKWKAYAGNVTGVLTLDDSGNYSIFQWQPASITGEVFATRTNAVSWTTIRCASFAEIYNEETAMNHSTQSADSINSTFFSNIHKGFFVGAIQINQSSCRSTFTWANDTAQAPSIDAPFQEILLDDGANLIYSTFINDNTQGFNFKKYDFQMLVAERGVGGYQNTRYYFYMELQ